MAIHVNTARQRGKLHIFGSWPMRGQEHMSPRSWGAVPYNEDGDPSINVSVARGPEAIAREISRRFLPAYRDLYAKRLAKQREQHECHNRTHANAARLASALGVPCPPQDDSKATEYTLRISALDTRGFYGHARVFSDTVDLDLRSISTDTALRILEVLNQPASPEPAISTAGGK